MFKALLDTNVTESQGGMHTRLPQSQQQALHLYLPGCYIAVPEYNSLAVLGQFSNQPRFSHDCCGSTR